MEKKYYNTILKLIKNHKRYSGLENILDEIIEDVYNHAGNVIEELTDENTIETYLNKIVSTSIITVPRRLDVNTRKTDSNAQQILEKIHKQIEDAKNERNVENTIEIPTSLPEEQDENILTEIETETDFETEYKETVAEIIEDTEITLDNTTKEEEEKKEEKLEEIVIVSDTVNITDSETPDINDDNSFENQNLSIEEVDSEVNISSREELVEKMINGASVENNELENDTPTENIVITEDDNLSYNFETEEDEVLLTENNVLETSENEVLLEDESESAENVLMESTQADLDSVETKLEFTAPKYNQFAYNPSEPQIDINIENIITELMQINEANKELKILDVFNLKYTQNKTILEISNSLNLSTNSIILALDKIIEVVKE